MLARIKNASPKVKILLGAWLVFEIASIPAAAGFAFAFHDKVEAAASAQASD